MCYTNIFVVLHPRHKLHYFKNARWPQEWIDTARDIVEAEFKRGYSSQDVGEDEMSDQEVCSLILLFYVVLHFSR